MTAPLALFRADASPAIGGGHVMRCLALADALTRAGWRAILAARAGTEATVTAAARMSRLTVPDVPVAEEPEALRRALPEGCDLLVVDNYAWTCAEERASRRFAERVAVLDDFAAAPHDADIVLDPTPGRGEAAYGPHLAPGASLLAGAAWAPLRAIIRARRHRALHARHGRGLGRILVAMGMTDPANATARVLEGLAASRFDGWVDVVLGTAAPHRTAVAAALPARAALHLDPPDLPGLVAEADLAIGAGGVSALERACLGLPTLLVELADNQRAAIAGLAAAGAARPLGPIGALSAAAIAQAISALRQDPDMLARMSAAAALVCDGLGAGRTAIAVAPGHTRNGAAVDLRPAEMSDAPRILAWQASPGMRTHFRTPRVPTAEEHTAWLSRSLSDPDRILSIIRVGGEAAGLLRLDRDPRVDGEHHEVSILISPGCQGRGVGKAALALAERLVPGAVLRAEVLAGNAPSRALFAAAGYRPCGETMWTREASP